MASVDAKADELIAKAKKKLNSWFAGESKYEDAAELYGKAANLYKANKRCAMQPEPCMGGRDELDWGGVGRWRGVGMCRDGFVV